jgi:hypothetical protein
MGDVQTQLEYPKGLDFEQVWAAIMQTDRLLKETIEENDKQRKEYNKRFGDIHNRFGEVVECMISPKLLDKFIDLGLVFQTASTNFKVRDHKNQIYFEIDVFCKTVIPLCWLK